MFSSGPLKPMSDVGTLPLLDLAIARKIFRARDGSPFTAVADFSLSVVPREFVCLIGPSGCGKTTILKIVLGLDRAFDGRMTSHPQRLSIGAVFQEPRLLPWRTVEQNIRLAMPRERRDLNLDELFETMGFSQQRHRYPAELSLGQARRVAIARALAVEHELLVLDEALTSLDDQAADGLRRTLLATAARHGTAVLMVTHNLREALELADRLIFLEGPPARIRKEISLSEPRDRRTEAWIESRYRDLTRTPSSEVDAD